MDSEIKKIPSNVQFWRISAIVLGVVVFILFMGDRLQPDTKEKGFYLVLAAVISFFIYQYINEKRNKIDIHQIGSQIANREYRETGRVITSRNMSVDKIDNETLLFGFHTGEIVLTYKYDIPGKYFFAVRQKKIDAVMDELDRRSFLSKMVSKSIERGQAIRQAEKEGFEIFNEEVPR